MGARREDGGSTGPATRSGGRTTVEVEVEGRRLTLSNLEKVLYPAAGFTKGDVLHYYAQVAPVLLPHVVGRPLTMKRYPEGVDGEAFYEKHLPRHAPDWVRSADLPHRPRSGQPTTIRYAVLTDVASLTWTANLASLELHVPMWRVDDDGRPQAPDLMVFDLDPGPPATITECARVALVLADLLAAEHGWTAYPKTSGSKGMQLYVPLRPEERGAREDNATRTEARRLAELVEQSHRDLVVSNMRKDLRAGRVLIDWSQNNVAKTTVAPYSLRARPEPTVSTPVTWDEVRACAEGGPADRLSFLPHQVLERVKVQGDLMAPLLQEDQDGAATPTAAGAAAASAAAADATITSAAAATQELGPSPAARTSAAGGAAATKATKATKAAKATTPAATSTRKATTTAAKARATKAKAAITKAKAPGTKAKAPATKAKAAARAGGPAGKRPSAARGAGGGRQPARRGPT